MNALGRTLLIAGVLTWGSATAAPFRLLRDVYPGANSGTSQYLVADDAKAFFWGYNGVSGLAGQPWISDGTVSGTTQVGEIVGSSGAFSIYQPTFADRGIVYFVANDGFHGRQLWRSDGTFPGTFALTHASGNGLAYDSLYLTPVAGVLVFEGGNATDGFAVMGTDGTVVGTQVLLAGAYAASGGAVQKGRAVLPAGSGFVVTDGTPGGTSFFSVPGLTGFSPYLSPRSLAAVNEVVYFAGTDGTNGNELWKTDGTQGGTVLVKDIFAGPNSSYPLALTRVDDRLFFIATTPDAGQELWMSDGTADGTVRVKDIHPGILDSAPEQLTALNGVLYFVANSGTTGKELWRSDGTDVGTTLALGDFNPGSNGAFDYTYDTVQAINHKLALVMAVAGSSYTTIPYVSDGTLAGTQPMDTAETVTVFYSGLTAANGKLFASGTVQPSNIGNELIATDAFATLGNTWCANPEEAIPDNLPAGLGSQFHLPGYGGITKLTVSVDIGHTNIGDLSIKLKHQQTGTEVVLFDRPPNSANLAEYCPGDLLDIEFDDSAGTAVQSTCVDARVAYPRDQSLQPASPLSAFDGESLAGDWTLTATDNASGDIGILHEWCMNFTTDRIFADAFD